MFEIFDQLKRPNLNSRFIDNTGMEYVSVSRIIEYYSQPFDEDKVSQIVAKKRGITQKEILLEWKLKAIFGEVFHCYVETFLTKKRIVSLQMDISKRVNHFTTFYKKFIERFEIISVEQIVADFDQYIIGIADVIAFDTWTNAYFVIDWKTNDEIPVENKWGKMKGMFNEYDDSKFNHYTLQLNLLTEMCRKNFPDKKWVNGIIVHITDDTYKILKVPDMNYDYNTIVIPSIRKEILEKVSRLPRGS